MKQTIIKLVNEPRVFKQEKLTNAIVDYADAATVKLSHRRQTIIVNRSEIAKYLKEGDIVDLMKRKYSGQPAEYEIV